MPRGIPMVLALALLLPGVGGAHAEKPVPDAPPLPACQDDEAWSLLPRKNPPLPAWARVLVKPLPRTTGAMLELDYLHRARNPLPPLLAGKLRWMAAHTLGSVYAERYAEADLRRAGMSEADLKKLAGDPATLSADDRTLLAFARKMTRAASTVTDAEMADLLRRFGPDKVVAMVHTLAYANFHGRIILALGVEVEPQGPIPPHDYGLDPAKRTAIKSPRRPSLEGPVGKVDPLQGVKIDWGKQGFDMVLQRLEEQKNRAPRISLPDKKQFAKLPPSAKRQAEQIVWMTVSMGFQPELTRAWFECLRAFQSEAQFNRVFSGSVFWVVTRTNDCFY